MYDGSFSTTEVLAKEIVEFDLKLACRTCGDP